MPIALSINGQTRRFDAETISVGRSPENAVSLPHDERLAPVHAILKCVAGRWIVEAQAGGLVRVGNGRPTQFAWINPGDVIHVTESGPQLVFEPDLVAVNPADPASPVAVAGLTAPDPKAFGSAAGAPNSAGAAAIARPAGGAPAVKREVSPDARPPQGAVAASTASPSSASRRNLTQSIIAGGVAAFLLIGLGVLLSGRAPSTPEPPQEAGVAIDSKVPIPKPPTKAAAVAAGDPKQSLFRLELQTADGKRAVQLGTAWAIGPRRLVTTGDAARGIALNQEFYPTAVARHSLTREPFEIATMTLHPQYETAANRLDQAVRRIEQLKSAYDQTKDPAERRQLEGELREQDSAAILAADEAVNVNVAIIDVGKDLVSALPWAGTQATSAKIGQKLTLVGHPLSSVDFLVDPDHPVPPEQRVGRLRHVAAGQDPHVPARWLVGFDDPLKEQNWSGSPVLDSNGVAVGVYVRPTPPVPGADGGAIVTHDITVLESLRALITGSRSKP